MKYSISSANTSDSRKTAPHHHTLYHQYIMDMIVKRFTRCLCIAVAFEQNTRRRRKKQPRQNDHRTFKLKTRNQTKTNRNETIRIVCVFFVCYFTIRKINAHEKKNIYKNTNKRTRFNRVRVHVDFPIRL